MELTADRGEREDWFASGLIAATAIISLVSLTALIFWELRRKDPIIDLRLYGNRNFGISSLFMFTAGLIIFGTTQLIPQMLQQVQGYSATDAGLALTTGGLATLLAMPLVGVLVGRVRHRYLLFPALVVQGLALWNLAGFSIDISFGDASQARLFQSIALPFLFVPVNSAAYVGLRQDQTAQASALLNVARNLGGTIGISTAQTLLLTRQQFHQAHLVEGLNPLNPSYNQGLAQLGATLGGLSQDAMASVAVLYQQVLRQATMLAYLDVFHVFMIFVFAVAPFALLLRQGSDKAAGAH
jgi:DHA2 family multidrug resistance protein